MLVLLMGGIYKLCLREGLKWHYVHAKFHKDWFRYSNFVQGINIEAYIHRDRKVIS
jgi:hypothetical protein